MASESLVRNISDTALWVAAYRALESERPDAVFRDPLARRLAGERGEAMLRQLTDARKSHWAFVARTVCFDQVIERCLEGGAERVVNLAAGLDTRPYRMELPPKLTWVEVDLPDLLDYKEEILAAEAPRCRLERVRLDLSHSETRRELFTRLGESPIPTLVVSEGLIIYLESSKVAALARDLAAIPGVSWWANDPVSPALLRRLQRSFGRNLKEAGAPLKFAPERGPAFFEEHGWKVLEAHSLLHTAARLRRVGWFYRLLARFPDRFSARAPWGGVCLLGRPSPT